jgi:hypothetical protein
MNIELIILITIGCLALYLYKKQAKIIHGQNGRIEELSKQVEQLTTNINVLCASAVGVDKRVIKLERNGRDLIHRQEHIESSQQPGDRPYGEAIEMVHKGAGVSRLIEELDMSKSEAELLVMLHGVRKAG